MKVRDKVSAVNRVNDPADQGFVTPSFQPPFGVNFFPFRERPRFESVWARETKTPSVVTNLLKEGGS